MSALGVLRKSQEGEPLTFAIDLPEREYKPQ